ncbi:MAG: alkaline phosphatase family protein [Polyangiaceae bacterium]
MQTTARVGFAFVLCASLALPGCGGDDESDDSGGGGKPSGGAAGSDAGTSGGSGGASGGSGGSGGSSTGGVAGATGGAAGAAGTGGSYDLFAAERKSCKFTSGSKTTETIGPKVPHGDAMPFEHIVVLMQENRSFDHYFSNLVKYGVAGVDVPADNASNPDPDATTPGSPIARFHETRYCVKDVEHDWEGVHQQYDNGKMDGFVATNNPGGARAMGYYTEADLPYYYWMAKSFAISDRHFCSLLGPTWPNRFYFYGGTSWGNIKTSDFGFLTNNVYLSSDKLLDTMDKAGRSWKIYRDGITSFAVVFGLKYLGVALAEFDKDVDADKLPALSIIDPSFTGGSQNDEHPPSNMQLGQALTARVLNKLMSKPAVWNKTVFILFYDEHGGFYDHVPPPEACEPDGVTPPTYKFNRLGIRTPLVIAAPWVKPGYVSHVDTDITSVTRFIQNRFDLPALTARDANAWPMLDFFDFEQPALATPPTGAPSAQPSQAGIDWCKSHPPGTGKP